MTGGNKIRAVGPSDAQDAPLDITSEEDVASFLPDEGLDPEATEEWEYEEQSSRSFGWILPSLAISTALGWTGFFGWAYQTEILAGGTPQQWAGWITSWAVPPLLIVALWLLTMRNSKREAQRFGAIANTLSQESALLEGRLTTVNRELSLAREFLGSQSRELESLGRVATDRLTEHAGNLQSLIYANGEQIDAIANVSGTALENMSRLRDDLPVLANSAKDVSNQIGTAGRTAHAQIAELISGFGRLNDFGKASESQVESIQSKIETSLTSFAAQADAMEQLTETRFNTLMDRNEAFRNDLDSREVELLAAIRRRAEALETEFAQTRGNLEQEEEEALRSLRARLSGLRDETGVIGNSVRETEEQALEAWKAQTVSLKQQLVEAIEEISRIDEQALTAANTKLEAFRVEADAVDAAILERTAQLFKRVESFRTIMAQNETASLSELAERFEKFDTEIVARRQEHIVGTEALAQHGEAIAYRMGSLRTTIEDISELSTKTQSSMSNQAEELAVSLEKSLEAIEGTDSAVNELTQASVRLLELIQASAQHSAVDLTEALSLAEARLMEVRGQAEGLGSIILQASENTEQLSEYVLKAQDTGRESIADVDGLRARISASNAETHEAIGLIRNDLAGLNEQSEFLSSHAQKQLRNAIEALEQAAQNAPATIEKALSEKINDISASMGATTSQILNDALESAANNSITRIEESAAKASSAGRDTTIQLRDQLSKVNELTANLESRVARARERAEEQVGNDFARRMALITESLNSNAIDIAKAMSADVTDTAWASYLRGDRGIFTRRAVRLLDNTEARDIAEIYDAEPEFRENVSRYIHDFEAMLRSMLSTRDGNALGVTLLSSDMGKLYVALAQSIERLRD
ncbi:hypothetical protein GCM10023115_16710 [Pontixanthobacter gangjinensis]|uniref:ATPase n=1 Tax=Pontixanthobacter gangjinensis TaxID=1028742 RepID=A0A6I4SMK9_9SPHN|nr:ATPase [Pontixanthobacter gangjinensis]MXO56914.1 ATPase [Pontixanthobacter gangjinensis]